MAIPITMPVLGLTMTEGTIQSWLKRVGDPVGKDEPLAAVETDKAVMEIVSPAAGVLGQILAAEGARVPVNQIIAYLAAPGEIVSTPPSHQSPPSPRAAEPAPSPLPTPQPSGRPHPNLLPEGEGAKPSSTGHWALGTGHSSRDRLLWLYRTMLRIRAFDERIVVLFSAGKIAGALHSYVGEEAVAAGVGVNLRPDDYIVSTHRGHGHLLAKGGDMRRMMAELFGKVDGYCRGKGGSMHITDVSLGILGANGIVGAGVPIATGAGTAIHLKGGDQVVVCFFGDGAANIGTFHEGVNLAATWQLPIVFVCENNHYAQFTPQRMHTRVADVHRKGAAYGIPGIVVDGNDAEAVATTTAAAIDQARRGEGPVLVEAKTYRWYGHAINNPASAIGRDEAEIAAWKAKDPIPRLARRLLDDSVATEGELSALRDEVAAELDDAIRFAEASPSPAPEDALADVYTVLPEGTAL